ncbi:MAG: dipeptidyl-peptidase 3 family protein [Vicinamibacterales bacterium]
MLTVATAACSRPEPAATDTAVPERKYLLERIDDAAVVQVYADGFESLPLREKTLIWHLYQAAVAGRDIFYDQRHRHGIEMRRILEAVITHPQGIDTAALDEIRRYTKLFWLNTGPYNNHTSRKFVLGVPPRTFAAAVKSAVASGATIPTAGGESLEAMLTRLEPMFFDPNVDPIVTNRNPGSGRDILTASANNLYAGGVTTADLTGFTEQYGLNSRLVKRDGKLIEEVYRIGGRYSKEITEIVRHLEAAIPFATEPMAKALGALVKFYRSGETADRVQYDIAWVADKASPVDTINGFIEVYMDPRGIKGSWEALVFYVNPEKAKRIKALSAQAQWFEDHMPFDPRFRKPNVTGIVANAIDVVIEMGDSGPITPIGINLPNDEQIRERYGSKSVALANVTEAYDKSTPEGLTSEFTWDAAETARAKRFRSFSDELHTELHEVLGHASGRQAPGFKGSPDEIIKEHYSALEEARADLIALYFIADPKLVELGVVSAADHDQMVRAQYDYYTRNAIVQLRRIREGTQIEEAHLRNRQMIIHWLMANTKAIERRQRDGQTFNVLVDQQAFRDGVGRLLADVQRIKSEGGAAAAAKMFNDYGIHFDPKLRDEVVRRVDALKLPSYTGFVMPKLTPALDAGGNITDVRISYPQDLTAQMLEYSAATR